MTETWQEFRVSNDCINDAGELRRRLDDDGYLFFRKLQNRDKLLALRRDMTGALQAGGWLVPGRGPDAGDCRCVPSDNRGGPRIQQGLLPDPAPGVFSFRSPRAGADGRRGKDHGQKGHPAPREESKDLVSPVQGTHHPPSPGLRPLPGQHRDPYLLGSRGGLPYRAGTAGGAARAPTR